MKITEVEYQQVKSIGNYETCRATAKVLLEDGESPEKAFEVAKACVRRQLGMQEKQKEEDKEKNRQREAMKTKITDGPIYGYTQAATPGYLTHPEYIEARRRPTQEADVTNQAATGGTAIRAGVNRPREIVFRATREGVNAEPNHEIRAIPAPTTDWNLEPFQQEIINQHMRNIGAALDRRLVGVTGNQNQIGIAMAAGGGGAARTTDGVAAVGGTENWGNLTERQLALEQAATGMLVRNNEPL